MQKNGAGWGRSWEKIKVKVFRDNIGKRGWGHIESQDEKVVINIAGTRMSPIFLLEYMILLIGPTGRSPFFYFSVILISVYVGYSY